MCGEKNRIYYTTIIRLANLYQVTFLPREEEERGRE